MCLVASIQKRYHKVTCVSTSLLPSEALLGLDLLPQCPVFRLQFQVTGHAIQQHLQFIDIERLRNIVVSAIFHRLYGRLDRAVSSYDHYQRFRAMVLDLMESLQTTGAGKFQIKQHSVDTLSF